MNNKPSIPQGTRDFNAETIRKRNYIFSTIRSVFECCGFEPLETPALENIETLMGKYGEEGDKLVFKILNNGLNNKEKEAKTRAGFEQVMNGKTTADITERALKYDLTIPFARYVAMNRNALVFPFKRYQVQPVWRADRPQKGRYREFWQCDADVVGSDSLLYEAELAFIYATVFTRLRLTGYRILMNNRKILSAIAESCGASEKFTDITIAIDKLDKLGLEKVMEELKQKGFTDIQLNRIRDYLCISGNNDQKLEQLSKLIGESVIGKKGMTECRWVLDACKEDKITLELDLTLARGLDYYTGIIYEAQAPPSVKIGSIGGGGRYDDLTGLFGSPGITGVGISFGVDRIYDVLEEMDLFPPSLQNQTKAVFFNLGEKECMFAYKYVKQLRNAGIACEIFPDMQKIDKQFKYAERKKIPFAIIIGSHEMEKGIGQVKDLTTGTQKEIELDHLVSFFTTESHSF